MENYANYAEKKPKGLDYRNVEAAQKLGREVIFKANDLLVDGAKFADIAGYTDFLAPNVIAYFRDIFGNQTLRKRAHAVSTRLDAIQK